MCLALALGVAATPALAAKPKLSPREARERVERIELNHQMLLLKFPRLSQIDQEIQGQCGRRVLDQPDTPTYCRCASAVTMAAWRVGDPNMLNRLVEFTEQRGDHSPADFLAYQGPELYRPLCDLAFKAR